MSTRLPRYRRVKAYPTITIGRSKHLCLTAIARYHYLTAEQITRLVYGTKVLSTVRQHLMELYQAGYVNRVFLPTLTPHGSALSFYCLDNKGHAYLRGQGIAVEGRFRASEQSNRHWLHLAHTRDCNDLMILAHQLVRADPRITITRLRTERELKQFPLTAIPDGWLEFHASNHADVAFELDRDTMTRADWNRKLAAYNEAVKGQYQSVLGAQSLTLAVVVTTGERRLQELLNWTRDQLGRLPGQILAPVMLFAHFNPAIADPTMVFTKPVWRSSFDQSLYPLLDPALFRNSSLDPSQ